MRYALRNIARLKTKSFLSFSITLAILLLSMFGVLTITLCEENRERFYGPLDGSVHVTDENFMPFFTYEAAEALDRNAKGITKISAVMECPVYFSDLAYLGKETFRRNTYAWERIYYPAGTVETEYHEGFLLCAVTAMDILEEIYSGDLVMLEGTMISETNNSAYANKIVISSSVAKLNGLKLGDRVYLDPFSVFREEESARKAYLQSHTEYEMYEYIVGGIYENHVDDLLASSVPSEINENKVYIPISTLTEIAEDPYLHFYGEANYTADSYEIPAVTPDRLYFHMKSIKNADVLAEMINEIGFAKRIVLTPYISDAASSPSARLSNIISILLCGINGLGFFILALSVLFNMKARHRELAMLSALGQKRSAVAFSFFAEIFILMLLSLFCGGFLFLGMVALLIEPFSDYLYASELSSKISNESAGYFLILNEAPGAANEKAADIPFLVWRYILSGFTITAVVALCMIGIIGGIVFIYVKRINALSEVGGKE